MSNLRFRIIEKILMNYYSLLTVIEFMKITDKLSYIFSVIMIDFSHRVDRYLEINQKSANYPHFDYSKIGAPRVGDFFLVLVTFSLLSRL